MNQKQQRQLDAIRRAEDFVAEHTDSLGVIATSESRTRLQAVLAAIAAHTNEQGTAGRRIAGEISTERRLTVQLLAQHVVPISTFARARLRGTPAGAALVVGVGKRQGSTLVRVARSLATAAAPFAEELTRGGFPVDAIAQLIAATDALEAAIHARANIRVAKVGATRGIQEQIQSGREAVTMLHAVISREFADDRTFLASWNNARRVTDKPGATRTPTVATSPVVAAA